MSLIKSVLVDSNGDDYLNCDNASDSLESLLKRSIFIDDDGNNALALDGVGGGGGGGLAPLVDTTLLTLNADNGDNIILDYTFPANVLIAGGTPIYRFIMTGRYTKNTNGNMPWITTLGLTSKSSSYSSPITLTSAGYYMIVEVHPDQFGIQWVTIEYKTGRPGTPAGQWLNLYGVYNHQGMTFFEDGTNPLRLTINYLPDPPGLDWGEITRELLITEIL